MFEQSISRCKTDIRRTFGVAHQIRDRARRVLQFRQHGSGCRLQEFGLAFLIHGAKFSIFQAVADRRHTASGSACSTANSPRSQQRRNQLFVVLHLFHFVLWYFFAIFGKECSSVQTLSNLRENLGGADFLGGRSIRTLQNKVHLIAHQFRFGSFASPSLLALFSAFMVRSSGFLCRGQYFVHVYHLSIYDFLLCVGL